MLTLRVNDLKQWLYCPRIVFYHYTMPVEARSTWKMQEGHAAQDSLERLEKRRKFGRYGLEEARRQFNIWLSSERLGLTGKLDMLLESAEGLFPVDFKMSSRGAFQNHVMQLAGYALLVEEKWQREAPAGFVYLTLRHEVVEVPLGTEVKQRALEQLAQIRDAIRLQRTPPPTPVRRRCDDCEYRNFCADIF